MSICASFVHKFRYISDNVWFKTKKRCRLYREFSEKKVPVLSGGHFFFVWHFFFIKNAFFVISHYLFDTTKFNFFKKHLSKNMCFVSTLICRGLFRKGHFVTVFFWGPGNILKVFLSKIWRKFAIFSRFFPIPYNDLVTFFKKRSTKNAKNGTLL